MTIPSSEDCAYPAVEPAPNPVNFQPLMMAHFYQNLYYMHQMQAAAAAAFSWQVTPPVALFASSLVTYEHVEPEKKEEEVHPKAATAPDECQPRTLLCVWPGCGKAFSRKDNLTVHVRTHTGEKPYPCELPLCQRSFTNRSDQTKHQERAHGRGNRFVCPVDNCYNSYTDPSSLRKHLLVKHGESEYEKAKKEKRVYYSRKEKQLRKKRCPVPDGYSTLFVNVSTRLRSLGSIILRRQEEQKNEEEPALRRSCRSPGLPDPAEAPLQLSNGDLEIVIDVEETESETMETKTH